MKLRTLACCDCDTDAATRTCSPRERGVQLREAVDEWTARNGVARGELTTGFLDGTHPLVDVYELKV